MKTLLTRSLFLAVLALVSALFPISPTLAEEQKRARIENGIVSFPEESLQGVTVNLLKLNFNFPADTPKEILAMKGKILKDDFSSNYVIPVSYNSDTKEMILYCLWEKGLSGKPVQGEMGGLYNPKGSVLEPFPSKPGSITWLFKSSKNGKLELGNSSGRGVQLYLSPVAEFPIPEPAPKSTVCKKNDLVAAFSAGKIVSFEKWGSTGGAEFHIINSEFVEVNGQKLTWTADDGNFCVGMKEKGEGKAGFWGCKQIVKLGDGSFYGAGKPETSGKIFIR